MPRPVSRREVLGAAVALALAACTRRRDGRPAPTPSASPPPDPDLDLVASWLDAEERLVARYAAHPRLAAFRAHHEAHAAALRELLPEVAPGGPSPGAVEPVRGDLARAEAALSRSYRRGAGAVRPERRLLVAELAASEAQHAALLGELRG